MSFFQRQSWFKPNSGSTPEVTSYSPKENHSSTSSTTQCSLVPRWASHNPSLVLHSHPNTKALYAFKLLDTLHVYIICVHFLTCKAFFAPEPQGSSHNVEEIKNRDIPSLAPFSLTEIAAVPQFLSCYDSYPIDCRLT